MRTFPGESVIGRLQVLSAVHVTLDPLAAPVSSTKDSVVALALFVALFQFVFATTPALSVAVIAVPPPTNLMLTAGAVAKGEGSVARKVPAADEKTRICPASLMSLANVPTVGGVSGASKTVKRPL